MQKSFVGAAKEFFGLKHGQSIQDFGAEVKGLSPQDKLEMAQGLESIGYVITDKDKLVAAVA